MLTHKAAALALFLQLRTLSDEEWEFKLNVVCAMAFDDGMLIGWN